MYKIKLRQDGWFESGRDEKGLPGMIYESKQELKKRLEKIGKKKTRNALEKELSKISVGYFKGNPYIKEKYVKIDHDMPGSCLIGEVRKIR